MTVGNPDATIATLVKRSRDFNTREAARWFRLCNTTLTFVALVFSALLAVPIHAASKTNEVATASASEQTSEGAARVPLWAQWVAGALAVGSAW